MVNLCTKLDPAQGVALCRCAVSYQSSPRTLLQPARIVLSSGGGLTAAGGTCLSFRNSGGTQFFIFQRFLFTLILLKMRPGCNSAPVKDESVI